MARVRWKNETKRATWFAACSQRTPKSKPPEKVTIDAHFRLHNLRDEDNLTASLKYALDALRIPRKGESFPWREGLAERKGYFVDDSPEHMVLNKPTQEVDRSNKGLTLTIAAGFPIDGAGL